MHLLGGAEPHQDASIASLGCQGPAQRATINFPEKQKHFQPSQPQTCVRPRGLQRGRWAGAGDTHLSVPTPAPQPPEVGWTGLPGQGRLLTSRKSYREPPELPKAISRGL